MKTGTAADHLNATVPRNKTPGRGPVTGVALGLQGQANTPPRLVEPPVRPIRSKPKLRRGNGGLTEQPPTDIQVRPRPEPGIRFM